MKVMIDTKALEKDGRFSGDAIKAIERLGVKCVRKGWHCDGRVCAQKKDLNHCYGGGKGYKCRPRFFVQT